MQTSPATFTKLIEMQFERAGKRTKFVGFIGEIRDESDVLIHSALYDTKPEAEIKLDALVRELLIDYAEQGLVDTLPEPVADNSASTDLASAQIAAQHLANVIQSPAYVVGLNNSYLVQDDLDLACYGGIGAIVATYQPQADDVPTDNPDIDSTPGTYGPEQARAYTLIGGQIEQTMQRNRLCLNCGGAHYGWQCPQVRDLVLAECTDVCLSCGDQLDWAGPGICGACREYESPVPTVFDTAELAQLWGASRTLLMTKLARLTRLQLLDQATAFAAWLNERTHAGLSATSVLHIWEEELINCAPALERAA